MVLKRLGLLSKAVEVMVEAVNREPLHWGAWQELALLIHDKDMVSALTDCSDNYRFTIFT